MNKRARILIVDDEPFHLEYLRQELGDDGVEYRQVGAAGAARERAAALGGGLHVILAVALRANGTIRTRGDTVKWERMLLVT